MKQEALTVADGMLEIFRAYGAEYIFSSPGSEWPPLWDALARASCEGKGPQFMNTRHEELAVSMAAGYYHKSGKLPIVVLHTTVGTLHGAMALRAARHERVPMLVLSGDSVSFGEIEELDPGAYWVGALADVGGSAGVAQPYVKRSSTVVSPEVLTGMVQDACRLALTPPFGPVYLSVPLEYMRGPCVAPDTCCAPPPLPPMADTSVLEEIAGQLLQAEMPVILTSNVGSDPDNVALLVELAESLAIPVIEIQAPCFSFPRDHALHQGFEVGELLGDADLVLLVAASRPWHPPSRRPKNARVILIDENPSYDLLPYWGYSVDLIVGGKLNNSLRKLNGGIERLADRKGRAGPAREARMAIWRERHDQQREKWRAEALAGRDRQPMDGNWVALTLNEILPADSIVVEEVLTHKPGIERYLQRSLPGTYFGHHTGGLGLGLGSALGVKVAAPDGLIVFLVGDGTFNYNPVLAGLGFAQQYQLPILVVIMDNQGYAAMRRAHLRCFPEGWAVRTGKFIGSEIEPTPGYAGIAREFGGYGERVEHPADLPGAIRRAIERVKGGQLALLDLIVENIANPA